METQEETQEETQPKLTRQQRRNQARRVAKHVARKVRHIAAEEKVVIPRGRRRIIAFDRAKNIYTPNA